MILKRKWRQPYLPNLKMPLTPREYLGCLVMYSCGWALMGCLYLFVIVLAWLNVFEQKEVPVIIPLKALPTIGYAGLVTFCLLLIASWRQYRWKHGRFKKRRKWLDPLKLRTA